MAFAKINWSPNVRELRIWAVTILVALGLVGSLFYFVLERPAFACFLWSFGALAFLLGITGKKIGLPIYKLWMGFVYVISTVIGVCSLAFVFYIVILPTGLLAKYLFGRDKLLLKKTTKTSHWQDIDYIKPDSDYERQF